mmetsp:Transcript_12895/g.16480  ORF Transcript_12895/g.16480 Transcript_12895/m.16480 type:complete len:280 (+) Transcript_12895:261-1100(+)
MANPNNDMDPRGRWFTRQQLGRDVWREGTLHARNNPDHEMYLSCGPVDSRTGLNERRRVLFNMESKAFSDLLGRRFANLVDDFPDTKDGKRQRKNGRETLKLKMKHALTESDTRLAAASLLTTTTTRVVSVLGVEHTFSFDKLMDDIYNVVMQYYDANRNIEAFDGVTKEQGLIKLLSLPGDQFNVVFNGRFDINADGFTASKNFVKEYVTKLMEASIATATAPTPTEQFQMMKELMNASASNINAVARTTASNINVVASILDAERVERIAGQVQHKAL